MKKRMFVNSWNRISQGRCFAVIQLTVSDVRQCTHNHNCFTDVTPSASSEPGNFLGARSYYPCALADGKQCRWITEKTPRVLLAYTVSTVQLWQLQARTVSENQFVCITLLCYDQFLQYHVMSLAGENVSEITYLCVTWDAKTQLNQPMNQLINDSVKESINKSINQSIDQLDITL